MYQIAIDGPAGAGKSTVAKALAEKLFITYLDTGAMYRALTYFLLQNAVDIGDETAVVRALKKFDISYRDKSILVAGLIVDELIRSEHISRNVSAVAALQPVRQFMVAKQRDIAKRRSIVLDGRDIGSVVLVDAQFKYFITASPEIRAKRRYEEQLAKGADVVYEKVLSDIMARDTFDSRRAHSPLVVADDAEIIDSSEMTVEEVVNYIYQKVKDET